MYYNDGKGEITTLIDDEARVYKGGSWKDRAYWLNPGSRRYMNQKRSSNDIGFRCAILVQYRRLKYITPVGIEFRHILER